MVVVLSRRYLAAMLVLMLASASGYLYYAAREHRSVAAFSWALANRVVVVDPGHGGIDPGAVGPAGTREKDITLAISLRLKQLLDQAGAVVVMTRESDTDLGTPGKSLGERKREDLDRRIGLCHERGGEIYLGIQANAFGTRWTGAQTFYDPRSEESRQLAEAIQEELRRILANTNRRAKALDAYILRHLIIPAVIVEVGFLSNPAEEQLLNDPYYQQKLALAIYSGVVQYLAHQQVLPE